jgi:outer membrane protein assembly factor BamA
LLSGYYTTNNQYFIKIAPVLYFAGSDNFIIESQLIYSKEIMKYYGTGNSSPEIDNPEYKHSMFRFFIEAMAKNIVSESMHFGINFDFSINDIFDYENNPELQDTSGYASGTEGGIAAGIGTTFLIDSRDNVFYPTSNGYYKLQLYFFGNFLGGKYDYNKFVLDLRQYWEPWESNILAFQLYFEGAKGEVPFFNLPALGGSNRMRGYFYGRYRDDRYLTIQAEYRIIVWWRLGIVAFYGIGDVGPDFASFKLLDFKSSYGFGLRFVFDEEEKINIRMDVGFGKETSGIYFGLEEAF